MAELTKPPLEADVLEDISRILYEIDKRYWADFNPLLISPLDQLAAATSGSPLPPKQPILLARILQKYASARFEAEASYYPSSPELGSWLRQLAIKTEGRILSTLPGRPGTLGMIMGSLTYHMPEGELTSAVREALKSRLDAHLSKISSIAPVKPDNAGDAGKELQPPEETEVQRRQGLLAEYKAATGASNKQIYEARNSGVHKPEFYDWLKGKLPIQSTPSQNFERFLVEKKRPIPRKPKT